MIDAYRCYEMITRLQHTPSRLSKEEIIKQYEDQKEFWKRSLDPMINYYLTASQTQFINIPFGQKTISQRHLDLLTSLSNGFRGARAMTEVINATTVLDLRSRVVYLAMINKHPDCGISHKTIEKIFPGLLTTFNVQLANLYKKGMQLFTKERQWCISPKIDGLRGLYINGKLYTRNGREIQGVTKLLNTLKALAPQGFSFDGELTVPGRTFNELSGDIRAFKETDQIVYNIFDVHGTSNEPLCARVGVASEIIHNTDQIKLVEHIPVFTYEDIDKLYLSFLQQGYEGAMLKDLNGLTYNGRNKDWLKLKPTYTADCPVINIEEGQGKYEGAVGALVIDFNGTPVKVGSGLTDKQRKAWFENSKLIVGKTIEVLFMEETEFGSLRHPRFKTVRGDK